MTTGRAITKQTKAILFDHDGTLIDSEAVHFGLWSKMLQPYGVELSEDFYCQRMAGVPVEQNALDVVEKYALSVDAKILAANKYQLTRDYLQRSAFPLMPYAKEAMQRCYEAGYALAIVTGGTRAAVEKTFDAYEVREMFSYSVAVEEVLHSKPAPDCYLKAAEALGLEPHNCVAVEDTSHGMQAAVRAGIPCVVIPTNQSREHDFSPAAAKYGSLAEWLDCELAR
ncbi:HAD family phosphatase [Alteromonas aestuariivivens]|uniref:HAD family phosphatase n=1 Tax=Alteromonas aestuariivivens TaxID=1938339 RepID=A0A3D8MCN7_9ALTE|nr:HAD family phosphatase [Alteromonas aestuariivivens]RDV28000.1 HAD family phosphatase [Alteromonas aestuariivivens]